MVSSSHNSSRALFLHCGVTGKEEEEEPFCFTFPVIALICFTTDLMVVYILTPSAEMCVDMSSSWRGEKVSAFSIFIMT